MKPKQAQSRRDPQGRFVPGKSGNPKGRPTNAENITKLAKKLSPDWLSELGPVGVALRQWQDDVIHDLGGQDQLSQAQVTLVQRASITLCLLHTVEDQILKLGNKLITKKDGLHKLVSDRAKLLYSLQQTLGMLGLEKKAADPKSIQQLLDADLQKLRAQPTSAILAEVTEDQAHD